MKTKTIEKQMTNENENEKIQRYLDAMNMTSNLTNSEKNQFIEIARAYQLNPFKREIYASKFGDRFSIIVGFETYIKRAERSGKISGWNVKTEGDINYQSISKSTLKAIITIYRRDWQYPFIHEVYFNEYCQRKKDGSLNSFWNDKPLTMIKKVAMAQGFRLCFSDELGGMPYTSDELPNETPHENYPEIETEKPIEKTPETKVESIDVEIINDWDNVINEIENATSIEQLKNIYQTNQHWHESNSFIGALTSKRKQIEILEAELIEIKKKQSHQKQNENGSFDF